MPDSTTSIPQRAWETLQPKIRVFWNVTLPNRHMALVQKFGEDSEAKYHCLVSRWLFITFIDDNAVGLASRKGILRSLLIENHTRSLPCRLKGFLMKRHFQGHLLTKCITESIINRKVE